MKSTYFTIFTSVYNRKHTVHRVWESLNNQTYKNFEWILINNGSQDGVEPLLEEYNAKADFKVRLIHQENKGKYMAFDRCVDLAEGELMIPADSDDRFDSNTLERLNEVWNKYKADDISGIDVLCKYEDGVIVGEKFPIDEGISSFKDVVYKNKVGGEKWGCVRVDLLKNFRFPKTFDVKFFPDWYVWSQIGFNYRTIYLNEPLRIYFQDAGNQITKEKVDSLEVTRMKNFLALRQINYIFPEVGPYPHRAFFHKAIHLNSEPYRSPIYSKGTDNLKDS